MTDNLREATKYNDVATGSWGDYLEITRDVTPATEDVTGATDDATAAIQAQQDALEDQVSQLEENIDALNEYTDAQRTGYDTEIDYREAKEDSKSTLQEYNEAQAAYVQLIQDGTEDLALLAEAEATRNDQGQELIGTVLSEADAYVEMRQAAVEAAGGVYTGQQRVSDFNRSIAQTANTIPSELIPQLVDMAMSINDIPEEHRTEVEAAIRTGDPAIIESTLNELSRTRTAQVQVNADFNAIRAIQQAIAVAAADKDAYINVYSVERTGGRGQKSTRATGGRVYRGQSYLVGEEDAELFSPDQDGTITNARQTEEMLRNGGSTINYNPTVNVNMPAGSNPQSVVNQVRKYTRTQGNI